MPVLNAFEQLLAEGYFEARVGAGTFVASSLPDLRLRRRSYRARRSPNRRSARRRGPSRSAPAAVLRAAPEPWLQGWGAFRVSQPAVDRFPFQVWSALVARHSRNPRASRLNYGSALGDLPFREAVADYLRTSRAVRCDAGQIMVVSGSQQALEIAARVLLDPGDRVWVEEPGYSGARDVLTLAGARIVPVPVDGEGLDVAAGIARAPQAQAAYVTPSHQYPLGATLSASRRLQLLGWAAREGAWIFEDDYDSEYRYESLPIASLQGLDRDARVIYIGTFSKVLFPAAADRLPGDPGRPGGALRGGARGDGHLPAHPLPGGARRLPERGAFRPPPAPHAAALPRAARRPGGDDPPGARRRAPGARRPGGAASGGRPARRGRTTSRSRSQRRGRGCGRCPSRPATRGSPCAAAWSSATAARMSPRSPAEHAACATSSAGRL